MLRKAIDAVCKRPSRAGEVPRRQAPCQLSISGLPRAIMNRRLQWTEAALGKLASQPRSFCVPGRCGAFAKPSRRPWRRSFRGCAASRVWPLAATWINRRAQVAGAVVRGAESWRPTGQADPARRRGQVRRAFRPRAEGVHRFATRADRFLNGTRLVKITNPRRSRPRFAAEISGKFPASILHAVQRLGWP